MNHHHHPRWLKVWICQSYHLHFIPQNMLFILLLLLRHPTPGHCKKRPTTMIHFSTDILPMWLRFHRSKTDKRHLHLHRLKCLFVSTASVAVETVEVLWMMMILLCSRWVNWVDMMKIHRPVVITAVSTMVAIEIDYGYKIIKLLWTAKSFRCQASFYVCTMYDDFTIAIHISHISAKVLFRSHFFSHFSVKMAHVCQTCGVEFSTSIKLYNHNYDVHIDILLVIINKSKN